MADTTAPCRSHGGPANLYDSPPPWDIGRPQPTFPRLAHDGAIRGRVLDAGCGPRSAYLPLNAGGQIHIASHFESNSLASWTGFGVFCLYAIAAPGTGIILITRRDA